MRTDNISSYITASDWDGLYERFDRMSNAEFRRSEQLVRTSILPTLDNDAFWDAYHHLLIYRRQAFLSSILAIRHLAMTGALSFQTASAQAVARWLQTESPASVVKVLRMAIPLLANYQQILGIFVWLDFSDSREIVQLLTKETSAHAYYALFHHLKHEADNTALLRSACMALMRKGDDMSFNMASILRSYFDIIDINSTLSLQVEPYELSYLDQSADNFIHVLKGRRPKLT